ncbi:protein kinase domain-containing protein [Haliangium sp.]|uniref:serine/threonine-protein kinase n=1 Tax=Haliangium sp. TaxID=2663208 RepID=UPI003D11E338
MSGKPVPVRGASTVPLRGPEAARWQQAVPELLVDDDSGDDGKGTMRLGEADLAALDGPPEPTMHLDECDLAAVDGPADPTMHLDERDLDPASPDAATPAPRTDRRDSLPGTPVRLARDTPLSWGPVALAEVTAAVQAAEFGPGTRISQHELIRELGRGGMGTVYLARDTKLGRRVAIKFLHGADTSNLDRFLLEARATARCSHDNIVVIHDVDVHQGRPYMVLEYLRGQPLSDLLGDEPMPAGRAVALMVPVVRALVCAHERGIVHRDLKPDNVFVTEAGAVKVLDFGIAKAVAQGPLTMSGELSRVGEAVPRELPALPASEVLTRDGALMGTLPYMAPEQWNGDLIDHRTDLWAVGIMMFRMLAGHHPLAPLRGRQLMITALLDQPMPRLRELMPELPPALAAAVDRCLIKQRDARMADAGALLAALEPLLPGRRRHTTSLRAGEAPYAGLGAFQEADADYFFGRTREITALAARLRERPLVGVVGSSGVGKSSFVRAGLIPALKRSGEPWEALVIRPGRDPAAALAAAVTPLSTIGAGAGTGSGGDALAAEDAVRQRLAAEPGYLGALLRGHARRRGCRILVFVDQFEELYTLVADPATRAVFTASLAGVADDAASPLRVVLSLRADFLDRVAEDARFMAELGGGLFFLTPPDRDGLREAITRPAEMAGYRFEVDGVVEHMLDTLAATPGALPLLQFAATKLWEGRDLDRRLLPEAGYVAMGGITGALASHADAVVAELPPQGRDLVRALFLRLVTPERTRAIASVSELETLSPLPGEVVQLVDYLVRARLLTVQTGADRAGASVELVHESLIHTWPLLRRWLDENQEDAAFLDELRSAARKWDSRGRAPGLLWRGQAMQEARRFQRRYQGALSSLEQDYLNAVLTLATRTQRRKRLAVTGVIGFLSLLVAAAAIALVLIREAQSDAHRQALLAQEQARIAAEAESKARAAETAVREQLARVQAEVKARKEAEDEAAAAKGQVASSQAELQRANAELQEALRRAREAQAKAERLLDREKERTAKLIKLLGASMSKELK